MRQIEQSQAVFGIAQQTGAIYWRAGCWFRIGCVAAMWALLTAAGPPDFGRAAVQLTVTTLGVAIAFLHTRVDTLALLRGTRWRPAKRLAEHLLGTPGRAAIDVSGLCEIIGAFAALWLFAGPWPVAGLTRLEQVFAVVAAVLYSLSAALQGMLDPGW